MIPAGCPAHRPDEQSHPPSTTNSVGADAHIGPPHCTPCKTPCHCEASAHTGCGERTERCRWQRKRSERVDAVKISSVRRKAAWKFWAPQQEHSPPPSSRPPCLKGANNEGRGKPPPLRIVLFTLFRKSGPLHRPGRERCSRSHSGGHPERRSRSPHPGAGHR